MVETNDGRGFAEAVQEEIDDNAKEITRDAMDVWFSSAQDRLVEAAEQRAGGGAADDSEGRTGRKNNALTDMLDEFQPPRWHRGDQAWMFTVTHAAAALHEWGAEPHEIRARQAQALAFEWPDAPEEIKEQFEDSFPTVFFNSIQHPGTPAIGFLRHGREEARQRLSDAGYSAQTFGRRGED